MKGQMLHFQGNPAALTHGAEVHFYTLIDPVAGLFHASLFLQPESAFLPHTLERVVGPACLVCPPDKFLQLPDFFFFLRNGLFPQALFQGILLFVSIIVAFIDGYFVCGFMNEQDFVDNLVQKADIVADNQYHTLIAFQKFNDKFSGCRV